MIWGMTLEPGKLYTEVIGDEVQLSMASLESRKDFAPEGEKPEGTCHIIMKTEKSEYLLCTLANGVIYQQSLDLKLMPREKVTFSVQGPNMVYLTGYSTSYPDMDDHYEGESETGEWEPFDTGGEMTLDNTDLNESAGDLFEEGTEATGEIAIKSEAVDPADESVNDDTSNQIEGGANQDMPMETPNMADQSPSQPLIQPKQEPGEESDQQDMIFSVAALDNVKQEPQDSQDDITIIPEDDDEDDQPQQTSEQLAQQQLQLHEQQQLQELQSQLQQHSNQLQQQQQSNQYMQQQQAMMQQRAPVRARGFPQMRRRGRGRPAGSLGRQRQRFSQPAGAQQTFQQNQPMRSSFSQMMPAQGSPRMPTAGYQGTPGQSNIPMQHQDQAMLNQPGPSRQAVPGPSSSSYAIGTWAGTDRRSESQHRSTNDCPYCAKTFPTVWRLKRHINVHIGLKPFACRICSRAFSLKDKCRRHEKTHSRHLEHYMVLP